MKPFYFVALVLALVLAACAGPRPAQKPGPEAGKEAAPLGEGTARLGAPGLLARARTAFEAGDYGEATEAARRARAMAPDLDEAWRLEARARAATGDRPGALAVWTEVLGRVPGDPEAAEAAARLAADLGRDAEVGELLAGQGEAASGWAGWLALRAGRPGRARDLLAAAVAAGRTEWRVALGRALLALGDLDAAAAEAERATAERPDDPEAWLLAGDVAREQGLGAEARAAYEAVLARDPGRYAARVNLASVLLSQGEAGAAEELLREAAEGAPGRPEAWTNLGLALRSQGRYAEAAEAYHRALEARPGYLPALKNLGICYEKYLGRLADAIQVYDRYLGLAPGDEEVARWRKAAERRAGEK
ncbi:tetratricopeptide repeat protein [Deferrisoma sp.]